MQMQKLNFSSSNISLSGIAVKNFDNFSSFFTLTITIAIRFRYQPREMRPGEKRTLQLQIQIIKFASYPQSARVYTFSNVIVYLELSNCPSHLSRLGLCWLRSDIWSLDHSIISYLFFHTRALSSLGECLHAFGIRFQPIIVIFGQPQSISVVRLRWSIYQCKVQRWDLWIEMKSIN